MFLAGTAQVNVVASLGLPRGDEALLAQLMTGCSVAASATSVSTSVLQLPESAASATVLTSPSFSYAAEVHARRTPIHLPR
jgi:hypothetical protein